jgi:hypothetical protein
MGLIVALEYENPDGASGHLVIHRAQVHMFTPEEVHNPLLDEVQWGPSIGSAAVVNLGKSEWLLTFDQRHLALCNHYRIMFYDEYFDIICENISAEMGPYRGKSEIRSS